MSLGTRHRRQGQARDSDTPGTFSTSGLRDRGEIEFVRKPNRSAVISTTAPYKRASIAQPDIADVNLIGPRSLLDTAIGLG